MQEAAEEIKSSGGGAAVGKFAQRVKESVVGLGSSDWCMDFMFMISV